MTGHTEHLTSNSTNDVNKSASRPLKFGTTSEAFSKPVFLRKVLLLAVETLCSAFKYTRRSFLSLISRHHPGDRGTAHGRQTTPISTTGPPAHPAEHAESEPRMAAGASRAASRDAPQCACRVGSSDRMPKRLQQLACPAPHLQVYHTLECLIMHSLSLHLRS